MKDSFVFLACLLWLAKAGAQQLPLFTQYREYQSVINPGAVSSDFLLYEYTTSAGLSYRNQFTGLPKDFNTQLGRIDYLNTNRKYLLSGYLLRDQAGPSSTSGAYLRMGYLISYDPRESGLGIGLSGGMANYLIKTKSIQWTHLDDPAAAENIQKAYPDVGAGAFYYRSFSGKWAGDKWYIGISFPQMFSPDLNARDPQDNRYRLKREMHYYGNLGLIKHLNENSFLEFSAWLKYLPGVPVNVDFNFRSQFGQILFLGTGYSTSNNLHFETGMQIGDLLGFDDRLLRIGYSFDRYFTQIGPTLGPAHEINLIYAHSAFKKRG